MRIAHVSTFDTNNIRSWSGTGYYIPRSLISAGIEIDQIAPLYEHNSLYFKAKQAWHQYALGQRHLRWIEPGILRGYAQQVNRRLSPEQSLIFSIWTHPVAFLETSLPIIFWADATFAKMAEFYPDWSKLSPATVRNGHLADRNALQKAAIAIYSSDWAAQSAIKDYGAAPERIRVVPFGANIPNVPDEQLIQQLIRNRTADRTLRLLFVGVEWFRKGADIAVETVKLLNDCGVSAQLTIIGCIPPPGVKPPENVKIIPFLDKHKPEDAKIFRHSFEHARYFILPSRAEAFGIVMCEASAFGVPSFVPNTGGIPSVIRTEENGILLPAAAQAADYAAAIIAAEENRKYDDFALSSFAEFKRRLNWDTAGKTVANIIKEIV